MSRSSRFGFVALRRGPFQVPGTIKLDQRKIALRHPHDHGSKEDFLTCFVDEYVARTRLFASRKFREELYDKAIEVKIKSFPDVKTQYELGLVKYTNVFVNGLINYMNSVKCNF